MEQRPFYHEGMRRLQDRFDGRRVADTLGQTRTHYAFWPDEIEMIRAARFFFIATAWRDYVDCSVKAGDPGFVKVQEPATLEYPEYDGNSMYRTLGNIAQSPNVGLLFVSFDGKSRRIRVNGKAYLHDDAETRSVITARNSWFASSARSSRIARAIFLTWRMICLRSIRRAKAFQCRLRRSGSGATFSGRSCLNMIRIWGL